MIFEKVKSVYLLGIGGIGMSALAKYFLGKGASVSGYDLTPSVITDELISLGINIHFIDDFQFIPNHVDLVIYTPAIPKSHNELNYFIQHKIKLLKRSEVLGVITNDYKTIAISGTHGKTTTTSACAHLFNEMGLKINAFIGGISLNFNSNYVFNNHAETFIVEADEFDRSFLTLHPDIAIVTSIEADHLDIYGSAIELKKSFDTFFKQIKKGGYLIYNKKVEIQKIDGVTFLSYSVSDNSADIFAENIHIVDGYYQFDLRFKNKLYKNLHYGVPGLHNLENAIAACASILVSTEVDAFKLGNALNSFKGVHRRFETVFQNKKILLIDDYAHHPTEISTCLSSIRNLYPKHKITAIFQPHLYSRTRDFADYFADSLAMADKLILLDIYPARELPIEGITSSWLLNKVPMNDKMYVENSKLITELDNSTHDIIVMMGAGNIELMVNEVKNYLEMKYPS